HRRAGGGHGMFPGPARSRPSRHCGFGHRLYLRHRRPLAAVQPQGFRGPGGDGWSRPHAPL
ncbi:hypothetical protein LTR94_038535, partial [Friedmanniomyces endolithicus]